MLLRATVFNPSAHSEYKALVELVNIRGITLAIGMFDEEDKFNDYLSTTEEFFGTKARITYKKVH